MLLNVPPTATAHLIRLRHRQLLKRWHPDLYRQGTTEHREATEMSKKINEAFSQIRHAPLRYQPNANQPASSRRAPDFHKSQAAQTSGEIPEEDLPRLDRIEFWVRFVCGVLFGILISAEIALSTYGNGLPSGLIAMICLGAVAGCGYASARWGDKFWYAIFRRWWLLP